MHHEQPLSDIVGSLLDATVRVLRLDFGYARLCGSVADPPIELVRLPLGCIPSVSAEQFGKDLWQGLGGGAPRAPTTVANPLGHGLVQVASIQLGQRGQTGVAIAASRRSDFPTQDEMLLLRLASDHVALLAANLELNREVIERKRAEAEVWALKDALAAQRKLGEDERHNLASLVEASTDFIGLASLDGRVLFVNPEGRKLVGRDADIDTTILDYVAHEDRRRIETEALPAVANTGRWEGEMLFRHFKTGRSIPMQTRIFFISEPQSGRRVALATISRDISEPKRAEQARQEADRRWRAVYDSWAVGIWLFDAAGTIIAANPALQRTLGYSESELQQLTMMKIAREEDRDAARSRITGLLDREISQYHAQQRYRRKDGSFIWANISTSRIPSIDGAPQLFVEIVEDIGERKQTEAALAQAQADLARVMRITMMGELAASIAHEVNQPLAAVAANAGACRRWLAAVPPNMAEASDAADRIIRDTARASQVISRIRGFLRRGELRQSALNIGEVIREVVAFVEQRASTQAVELRIDIAPDAPQVIADRTQLQQVLLNLMINALEAMQEVPQPRILQVCASAHGMGWARVAVSDSGVGVAAEQREDIFSAFFTTKTDGTGMGLAISRSIIEGHRGRLWAMKNEGRGESFQFVLPAADTP